MKKLTIREIIQATGAQMIALGDMEQCLNRIISHVTTDSREVKKGSLFVAVKGETRDGHDFIPQCFEQHKGIACFSEKVMVPAGDGILLLVKDTRQAFLDLAKYYRDQFDIPFIGITGSVGKTSTKDMVASVVSQKYDTLWTQGNFNNDLGVPLTLFRLEEHHQAAVIEMGMNHAGEIDRLAKVVRPDIGIISNVGVAHIEYLGSRENILKAKCEMFAHMTKEGTAILNADNDMLQTMKGRLEQKTLWFGVEEKADFTAENIEQLGMEKTKCTIRMPEGSLTAEIPVPGEHMVLNALSAAAAGYVLGLSPEEIKKGIETFVPTKNRMQTIRTESGLVLLNDVYNSNPVSAKASLNILQNAEGRKVAVLGFMGELGDFAPKMHREVGAYAAEKGIDLLCCVGKLSDEMAAGAKENGLKEVYVYASQDEFIENGIPLLKAGDTVLIKGSRSVGLEKTVEKLQGVN